MARVAHGNARAARSRRGYRARSARAVARSLAARRWLDGGKALPASIGWVPGRRWARRVETGLTETVDRRWGGRKRPAWRCSTAEDVNEGGWVLQLDRDPGVRRRRSIEGKSCLKGGSPEGGDNGDARQKSDARERPPVAGGNGPGAGTVGREVVLERGGAERGR
jgi:hypothetical protein